MAWQLEQQSQSSATSTIVKPTIVIGVPHRDNFSGSWIMGLLRTLQNDEDVSFEVVLDGGSRPVDVSRNVIVTQALKWKADYVFFIDSDIVLEREDIVKLIKVNKPIVSGVYRSRAPPNMPVANVGGKKLEETILGQPITMSVDEVGAGCLLIKTEVFKAMGAQFIWVCMTDHRKEIGKVVAQFSYPEAEAANFSCPHCKHSLIAPFFQYTLGFDLDNPGSEDYVFCRDAREAGYEIFARCDVVPAHENKVLIAKEGIVSLLRASD